MRSSSDCSCSNGSRYTVAMTAPPLAGPPRHRGRVFRTEAILRPRGALSTPADGLLERLHDHPLELGEPLVERGLGLDLDLELAAGEDAHAAGVHGAERDDDRLPRDAEPVEDLEDALDLGECDGGERHHASVTTPSAPAGAGPRSSRYQTRSDSTTIRATRPMKSAVTPASSRRLKICARTSPSRAAGTCPAASRSARCPACARKPIAGPAAKIFCQPAVMVTASSHASGTSAVQA